MEKLAGCNRPNAYLGYPETAVITRKGTQKHVRPQSAPLKTISPGPFVCADAWPWPSFCPPHRPLPKEHSNRPVGPSNTRVCRRFLTERRADRPKAHADSADRRSLAVPSETRRESEEGSRPLLDCPSRARRRPAGARWRRARSPTATPWAATGRQEGRAAAPGDSSPECPHAAAA